MALPSLLHMPRFVRFGIAIDTAPEWRWLALLALALWPTWWWMGQRMVDGSDDPLGLLALVGGSAGIAWQAHEARQAQRARFAGEVGAHVDMRQAVLHQVVVREHAGGAAIAPALTLETNLVGRITPAGMLNEAYTWVVTVAVAFNAAGGAVAGVIVDRAGGVPVAFLFAETIRRISDGESVTSLFAEQNANF